MTEEIHLVTRSLYEEDFNLWLQATAERLKAGKFDELDIENLVEEIESMGKSDRRALRSYLEGIIEHLLKLAYWDSERERNRNHWINEIITFRRNLEMILDDSPSLVPYLEEIFASSYAATVKQVRKSFKLDVPSQCPFTLSQIIDIDWFPIETEED